MAIFYKNSGAALAASSADDIIVLVDPLLVGGIDGLAGIDELRFASTSGQMLVLDASLAGIESIVIGTGSGASATLSGTTHEGVDATSARGALRITGNDGDNYLAGTSGDDSISGGGGNDSLIGGSGLDSLFGGSGDDLYLLSDSDVIIEGVGGGIDRIVYSGGGSLVMAANVEQLVLAESAGNAAALGSLDSNRMEGNRGANMLDGDAGDDSLRGMAGEDVLIGGAGNDTLDGGKGADRMFGGAGNDVYRIDSVMDSIVEVAGGGIDTVMASLREYVLGDNLENLTLEGNSRSTVYGNAAANMIVGNAATNLIHGLSGDDTLEGGGGRDRLIGGSGNDTYHVVDLDDSLVELPGEGIDTVVSTVSFSLAGELENLILTGSANLVATGNAAANRLQGNAGNNTLDGAAGADTLLGGAGDDFYFVDGGDIVIEESGAGTDSISSSGSYTLTADVENLVLTGLADKSGTGNALNNQISGSGGSDTLDGKAGNDTLAGGDGNDTYVVDSAGDVVVENPGEGVDGVVSSVDFTLGANLENLSLVGVALIGTGNTLNNLINGNAGSNTLDGGAGRDTLAGGAGNDVYVIDDADDIIVESGQDAGDAVHSSISYTLSASIEHLRLLGAASLNATGNFTSNFIQGNSAANHLRGEAGVDTLIGESGNDTLEGGAGADSLVGGAGDDLYLLDSGADIVVESSGGGTDTVRIAADYTLGSNLEFLELLHGGDYRGTGNGLANRLAGNSGNNTLDGAAGADTLEGGDGNDVYVVDNAGEVIIEAALGGTDTVQSRVSLVLGSEIENLALQGVAMLTGTGNALDNYIVGNIVDNTLEGGGGNDTLDGWFGGDAMAGGSGDDVFIVDDDEDTVIEYAGEGTDTVLSSAESWTLGANVESLTLGGLSARSGVGNDLANVMVGNAVANTLDGSGGNDSIAGAGGNDSLVGSSGDDSLNGGAGNDTLNGGDGADIAIFSGLQSAYTITAQIGSLRVVGPEGTDILIDVEQASFSGGPAVALPAQLLPPALPPTVSETLPSHALDALSSGAYWVHAPGSTLQLKFSFMASAPIYASGNEVTTFQTLAADQMTAVRSVLQMYERMLDIDFIEVVDSNTGVDLRFGCCDQTSLAYAYLPGALGFPATPGNNTLAGDVWIDTDLDAFNSGTDPGEVLYAGLIHEIGHSLGLKHPHAAPSMASLGHPEEDSDKFTVMSYQTRADSTVVEITSVGINWGWNYYGWNPETAMLYDVGVLQSIYGANMSANAGNTVWTVPDSRPAFLTIWDGGGTDTLSAAGFASSAKIDLQEGHYSCIGGLGYRINGVWSEQAPAEYLALQGAEIATYGPDNIAIAYGAVIENAIGGNGNDTLIGNGAANVFTGGAGSDRFVFNSGNAVDTVTDFASGTDKLVFDNAVFSTLGSDGALLAAAFRSGAGLSQGADADDRLIYDTLAGDLYYDPDGMSSEASVLIAHLNGTPSVSASDILIA